MSNLRLSLREPRFAGSAPLHRPLGQILLEAGKIARGDLNHALNLQTHVDAPLGEILIAEGLADRADVLAALSRQHNAQLADLDADPPEARLAAHLPAALCLEHGVVPWMSIGDTLLVATAQPNLFDHLRTCMGPDGPRLLPVVADERQIKSHISRLYGPELALKAATHVPAAESCRSWEIAPGRRRIWAAGLIGLGLLALAASPLWTLTLAMLWAVMTLLASFVLKAAAFWAQINHSQADESNSFENRQLPFRMPRVSVLVPLLREKEIAGVLIERLSRLTYPKSLLNVVLVLEAEDEVTRATLARTDLPPWISVIEVPAANSLTTKPRALNYALDFCEGSIIGVWDAEDSPEPDQIERVVTRFENAGPRVACLQGVLDYYNSRANWLSRCFTIEYAAWWRVILPGIAKLGLVIPLGGTTLFFRREVLEKLCRWDAHNVTEDADLGVRLARHGYITELLPTVTYEEANCRAWPWIKQRSRWLKGFLITWCVHMRRPGQLVRDLGWKRFWGLQALLLAGFCQFAFAPLLWSFWLILAGLQHPVEATMGAPVLWAMVCLFILAETLNIGLAMVAVSGKAHRHLMIWTFTLPLYFTLGAAAAFKALHEFVVSPFFWDKTQHGVTPDPDTDGVPREGPGVRPS
ncbi:MAG: glycosyltransferase [Sulfitobacter sp.]|nr:glycosyltransferase [Sulfitobacter sp.]